MFLSSRGMSEFPLPSLPPLQQHSFVGLCSHFPFLCPPPLFSPVFLLADGFQHSTTGQPGTAALPQVLIPAGVGIPALIPAPSVCPFISRVVQGNLGSAAGSLIQNKHQALQVLFQLITADPADLSNNPKPRHSVAVKPPPGKVPQEANLPSCPAVRVLGCQLCQGVLHPSTSSQRC